MSNPWGEEQPFTISLDGAQWAYGTPLADVKRLAAHWKDGFDWRASETRINALPMYTRDIEVDGFGTLNVHYLHQRSKVKNRFLAVLHGWPGHFLEVEKMLPLLTTASSDQPSFHVVAPSLPNFGFSEGVKKPGFHEQHYIEVLHKVMLSLGYEEYVYQGGDWGHVLGASLVTRYGVKHVKAWHTNLPIMEPPKLFSNPILYLEMIFKLPFDQVAKQRLAHLHKHVTTGRGYMLEQATKPQTVGYGVTDSPVGLLGWVYEKLVGWTDAYPWTDDEVLEWVSLHWIYYELSRGGTSSFGGQGDKWMPIPLGVSYFPKEIFQFPYSWSHQLGKYVYAGYHDKGGHFAAFEQPEALAGDLRNMYKKGGLRMGWSREKRFTYDRLLKRMKQK
ncbi:alpha/beta-hydrolase [Epithele typhae]|uniref:alpha/beta-hydrolase n=1 Tax=Epithele typhae TaxID=378194 RepID=UPI0020085525|nr:alpha/beta-hydrolase [Epithele typhae]KAH9922310.1 alpha/beta-hydrolase [Epithele typhae]